jgi:hypothetical protein
MRYLHPFRKIYARTRTTINYQYQSRNLAICIRYSSNSSSTLYNSGMSYPLTKRSAADAFTIDMDKVDTSERLSLLRQLMREHKVDIYSM